MLIFWRLLKKERVYRIFCAIQVRAGASVSSFIEESEFEFAGREGSHATIELTTLGSPLLARNGCAIHSATDPSTFRENINSKQIVLLCRDEAQKNFILELATTHAKSLY